MKRLKKAARLLASADIPFFVLPWLMLLLAAGTLAQKSEGLYAAQEKYFSSFILWAGPMPLPGGYVASGLLLLGLLAKFLLSSRWTRADGGVTLAHLGALLLLLGGLITAAATTEGYVTLHEGESKAVMTDWQDEGKTYALPFSIALKDVEKISYPGTDTAREYRSSLLVDGIEAEISMNAPFRYRGHALYQSSYLADDQGEVSVIAVARNPGWLFPYVASLLMTAGLIWHAFFRRRRK